MTDTLYGKVLSVETQNLGEPAAAVAAIGATVLSVADAATFDELGGDVTINGDVLSYTTIDVDADTLAMTAALAAAVAEGDYVEVYPPSPIKTALVDMGDNSDPLPATVPLNLLDRLPDGTRDPGRQETVALERRGTYEYIVADVTAEPVVSQTLDFTDAESGIALSEAVAQFADVNAIGNVGAASLSADSITLAGADLSTQLDVFPAGKLLSARLAQQGGNLAITTTSTKVFELNCGTVQPGRTYRVSTSLVALSSGTLAISDRFRILYRYTVDGSAPTTSSAAMAGGINEFNLFAGNSLTHTAFAEVDIAAEANLKVGMFIQLLSGAGSYSIYAGATPDSRPIMSLYDDGPSGARNDAAITLTGGGTTRFVKTFNPVWVSGSRDGAWDENANCTFCDVGNSSTWGNGMFGAFGFNSSDIVAKLAGASSPLSLVCRWRPRARLTAGGLDVRFLSHNYASLSAFTVAVFPQQWEFYGSAFTSQTTVANANPNAPVDTSLGTTLFGQFKSGTRKGLAIANSGSPSGNSQPDGSGSFHGIGAYQPQLIFTYDGTS